VLKSAGTGVTNLASPLFSNTGTVRVQSGTLNLGNGGTAVGAFSVATGTTLAFSGGTYELQDGSTESGAGTMLLSGGTLTVDGNLTVQNLTQSGGTLTGPGNLTVSGTLTWTGGIMAGTGVTDVAPGGFLNINGPGVGGYQGLRTVNNEGTNISVNPGNVFVSTDNTFTDLNAFLASRLASLAGALQLAYSNPIPLLGHDLNRTPGPFIDYLTPRLASSLQGVSLAAIHEALVAAFGAQSIPITNTGGRVVIGVPGWVVLEGGYNPFDIGLPGLPLHLDAPGSVVDTAGFTLNLNFSVSQLAGQSATAAIAPSTLQADVLVIAPGLSAFGTMGSLNARAFDDGSAVDLTYATTFATDNIGNLAVSTRASGSANVNLQLGVSLSGNAGGDQTLIANLNVVWIFSNADPMRSGYFGNIPTISFNNVQLFVGSFRDNFLAPVVSDVQQVTGPLAPLADFFITPVPVLSDLAADVGRPPIYLTDLLGTTGQSVVGFARAVHDINDLRPAAMESGLVHLGSFTVTDPRAFDSAGDALSAAIRQSQAANNVIAQISALGPGDAAFFNDLSTLAGFHFTMLDNPTNAFELLLGQNTTLFTYSLPPVSVSGHFTTDIPIPITLGLVSIHYDLRVTVSASATFGCDASGLPSGNLMDGFFLQSASVTFAVNTVVGVGFGIPDGVEVALDGHLAASATFTLTGTDGSGRVTGSELASGQFTVSTASDVQGALSIDILVLGEDVYSFRLAAFDWPIF
jgi:hypothetical protein